MEEQSTGMDGKVPLGRSVVPIPYCLEILIFKHYKGKVHWIAEKFGTVNYSKIHQEIQVGQWKRANYFEVSHNFLDVPQVLLELLLDEGLVPTPQLYDQGAFNVGAIPQLLGRLDRHHVGSFAVHNAPSGALLAPKQFISF